MVRNLLGGLAVAVAIWGCSGSEDSNIEEPIEADESAVAEASEIAEQVDNQAAPNEGLGDEEEEAVLNGEDMHSELAIPDEEDSADAGSRMDELEKPVVAPPTKAQNKAPTTRQADREVGTAGGGKVMYVKTYALNARSGPGTDNPVTGHYAFGRAVEVVEVNGTWAKDSHGSYVLYKYLSKTKPKKPTILWHLIKKKK